jgi:hypothetical protein
MNRANAALQRQGGSANAWRIDSVVQVQARVHVQSREHAVGIRSLWVHCAPMFAFIVLQRGGLGCWAAVLAIHSGTRAQRRK